MLSSYRLRIVQHKPLPNLQSIVIDKNESPTFIITKTHSFYLINSLIYLYLTKSSTPTPNYKFLDENILNYLKLISSSININKNLKGNWFLRAEIKMIYNYVILLTLVLLEENVSDLLKISQNIAEFIIICDFYDLGHLWNTVLFNLHCYMINNDSKVSHALITSWYYTYKEICMSSFEDYVKKVIIKIMEKI